MRIHGDGTVSRNFLTRSLSLGRTNTVVSGTVLSLNAFSTTNQIFTGTVSDQIVNLGDASAYPQVGLCFLIINDSTKNIIIKNFSDTTLFTLSPNYSLLVTLELQSTSDGEWRFSLFLDKTQTNIGSSASPGFTFGRSGAVPNNTWLMADSVPSNLAGRVNPLIGGSVKKVFIANANASVVTLEVYYHNGNSVGLTLLGSVTTGSVRTSIFDVDFAVPENVQLAIKAASSGGNNLVAGLQMQGSLT